MKKTKRHRPETTLYLGDDLYRELEEYRRTFTVPPSASALAREALRRFLDELKQPGGALPARAWVEATEPMIRHISSAGVSVSTDQILDALESTERTRTSTILKGGSS
jgi:hypothetical protein